MMTPVQFYLTERLHAPDATFSYYFAAFLAALIPTMLLYGFLCTRVKANRLLWWGAVIGAAQMVPLLFVHSAASAISMAVIMGLMGGICTAAYYDLNVRSCPPGLQGTFMMLTISMNFAAGRGSDFLGAKLYASDPENGFLYCVLATTLVYASILAVLPFIPRHITDTSDGERSPAADAEMMTELQEG